MLRPILSAIGLIVLLGGAGCTGAGSGTSGDDGVPVESVRVTPATADDVLNAVRNGGGQVTMVNVWATWCGPCMEEMPDILEVRRKYMDRGMKVILVSGDFDSQRNQVVEFLAELGVDFPSFIKTGADMEFIDTLSRDWSGSLPASFLYDENGRQVDFWEGKINAADLEKKVMDILGDA
jgi:thiol-disulfide isomerase/thioredoxin